jgi:hypothetical protein
MKKIETLEDLVKAVGGLAKHFSKAAEHHEKLHKAHAEKAEHHEKLFKAHLAHHEFVKAKHEAMDDGDVHKAYFGKVAEIHKAKADHHEALHKTHKEISDLHKAHAEHLKETAEAMEDGDKAAKAAAGAPAASGDKTASGGGVAEMVEETKTALVKKALASLTDDPEVAKAIQQMVLKGVQDALGDKIVPDGIRVVTPGVPAGLTPVLRKGQQDIDTKGVDPALVDMVAQ